MSKANLGRVILVVDDDESVRSVITMCLRQVGHQAVGTSGRSEVLEMLKRLQFDVIITDMLMPDFDGTEVIRAVKKHQPRATILAMSGGGPFLGSHTCLEIAKSMGAGLGLLKPFHLEELVLAVGKALYVTDSGEVLAN